MHDIRFIRDNPAAFDAGLKKRNLAPLSAKIPGARFVFVKGRLARMERAIAQFMLDLHTSEEGGYTEVNPPLLVRDNAAYGVGQLPRFADDMFHTDNGFWLVPTAEVPLTN